MKRLLAISLLILSTTPAWSQTTGARNQTLPETPRVLIATTLNATNFSDLFSSPVMKTVKASGGDYANLNAAFAGIGADAPTCGEIITVDSGYTSDSPGNGATVTYGMPCPAGKHVWVRPSNFASLPAQGTVVAAGDKTNMFKIAKSSTSNTNDAGFTISDGASGLVVTGMDLELSGAHVGRAILAGSQVNSSGFCNHITFDRIYIDTTYATLVNHAIYQGCTYFALVDSVVDHINITHADACSTYSESHDYLSYNAGGPEKLVDDTFGGSPTENAFWGGASPAGGAVGLNIIPSDVEFRRNRLFKDTGQLASSSIKNNFETKVGKRFLIDGNIMQYSYNDVSACGGKQNATMADANTVAGSGGFLFAEISDLTYTNNDFQHFAQGLSFTPNDVNLPTNNSTYPTAARMLVANNLFRDQNNNTYDSGGLANGYMLRMTPGHTAPYGYDFNVLIDHNGFYASATNTSGLIYFSNNDCCGQGGAIRPLPNFSLTNNVVVGDQNFIAGDGMGVGNGPNGMISYGDFVNPTFSLNVLFNYVVSSGTVCSAARWLQYTPGICPAGTADVPATINSTLGIADYASCSAGTATLGSSGDLTKCIITNGNGTLGSTYAGVGPNIAAIQAAQIEPNDSAKWGPRTPN